MADGITIDILRHGHCEGGDIYRGSSDVKLSDKGWQQMRDASADISAEWDLVVSSPLQRCRLFANEITAKHKIDCRIEDEFRETDFGEWEGKNRTQIWNNDRARVEAWWQDAVANPPPGGEDTSEFFKRVKSAFDQLIEENPSKHIGLVTHGGVIRVLLSQTIGRGDKGMNDWHIPYACVSRLRYWNWGGAMQLVFHRGS